MNKSQEIGVRRLAAMAFIQAVKDWEELCRLLGNGRIIDANGICQRGPKSTAGYYVPKYGFGEIEAFIRGNAELWVNMDADLIMDKLYKMRRIALTKARSLH